MPIIQGNMSPSALLKKLSVLCYVHLRLIRIRWSVQCWLNKQRMDDDVPDEIDCPLVADGTYGLYVLGAQRARRSFMRVRSLPLP